MDRVYIKRQDTPSSNPLQATLPSSFSSVVSQESVISTTSAPVTSQAPTTTASGLVDQVTSLLLPSTAEVVAPATTSATTSAPLETVSSAPIPSISLPSSSISSVTSSSSSSGVLASATQSNANTSNGNSNLGAIIGGSVGGGIGLIIIFFLVKWILDRRRKEETVEWYAFGDGADKYKPLGGGSHQIRDSSSIHPTTYQDEDGYTAANYSDPWSSRAPELEQGNYQDQGVYQNQAEYQDHDYNQANNTGYVGPGSQNPPGYPTRGMSASSQAQSMVSAPQFQPQRSQTGYSHNPAQSNHSMNQFQQQPYSDNTSNYSHGTAPPQYPPGSFRSESPSHY